MNSPTSFDHMPTVDGLLRDAWDKKILKEICEKIYVPSIFENASEKERKEGIKKANEMYEKLLKDPEKYRKIVYAYCDYDPEETCESASQ